MPRAKPALALAVASLLAAATAAATEATPAAAPLDEIVVIGAKANLDLIPGSGSVLDAAVLEESRVFTINEALRKVPGVVARDEEGFGLRPNIGIRGLNPTRSTKVLLLEDGLPLTFAPYGDNASYYHPPVDRFERIEVLKGAGQTLFGPQTIGGVINYITPAAPEELETALTVAGGERGYGEAHVQSGATLGSTGVLFNATRKVADGARENIRLRVSDFNVKLTQPLGERQDLSLRASWYDEDSDVPYSGLTLAEWRADPRQNPFVNDEFEAYRWSTALTHGIALGDSARLATSAYYTYFNRDWWRQSSNSGQRPNDAGDPACAGMANLLTSCGNEGRLRQYYTAGVEPRLVITRAPFGLAGETQLGLRAHREKQSRLQVNGDTPTARTPGTGPNGGVREDNRRDVDAFAAWAQVRFDFGAWSVQPGLRWEDVDYERTNRLTGARGTSAVDELIPGLGLSWRPADGVTVFAGAHRGFAPPRVEDIITAAGGSVDIGPELSWNYELGVRAEPRAGLELEATAFRMDFENQVVPASVAGGAGATLTSAGRTLHQGLEFSVAADARELGLTTGGWFARAALTWLPDAAYVGTRFSAISGTVRVTGNRLPYAPEYLATAALGWRGATGLMLQVEGSYQGAQFTDDLNTVALVANGQRGRIGGYSLWNVTANYELPGTGLTLFATVKNAADKLYIADMSRGLIPGMPRVAQLGATWRF